jgi:quinoprotein glucose dehydrogenase
MTADPDDSTMARPPRLFAVLLLVVGGVLAVGGVRLAMLGGSWYYLIGGGAIVASAVLLWRGHRSGAWLYGAMILGTAIWALWEVGLDGWALVPRLLALFVLGLWLLTPGVRSGLDREPLVKRPGPWVAASASAIVLLAIAGAWFSGPRSAEQPVLVHTDPSASAGAGADWSYFGATPGGERFSTLTQINTQNVPQLKLAWTYRMGDGPAGFPVTFEAAPLKVGDSVYFCTGWNDIIALDAETGAEKWRHSTHPNTQGVFIGICRGVAFFAVPGAQGDCAQRVLAATVDARLLALDARSGQPCAGFGQGGEVSLLAGMGQVTPGYYFVTSPPTIVHGKVVLGGWVTDGQMTGEPSGVIRAFDAVSGKFAWAWDLGRPGAHTEPGPGEFYTRGTPNSWAPMSVDESLGLVFAPTGNATPDYFGAERSELSDKYSSSVVAIDADTGEPRWSFQTTHHDLWDYDVGSQPTLVDVATTSGVTPALIQATKRGEIFLLDRRDGRPLATVEERPVPGNPAPGERLSPTQPFSTGMPSFAGPDLSEKDMWGMTPFDQLWCRIKFREARYDGPMTPPGLKPFIVSPGYNGGIDWGGVSVDPERQVLIVNSSRLGMYDRLLTRAEADGLKLRPMGVGVHGNVGGAVPQAGTPYGALIAPFLSPLDVPCQAPPYGMLGAIDLKTRKLIWSRPLGTAHDSGPLGIESHLPFPMGAPQQGGSVTTRAGLIFIAATQDRFLRAIDLRDGRELWRARLPAGGQANPVTYTSEASGRQFVVIVAGGHQGLRTKQGDYILAYALPLSPR